MSRRLTREQELDIQLQMLADGHWSQSRCPVCQGGRSGERTFAVWFVDNGIAYMCHRASCRTKGHIPHAGIIERKKPANPQYGFWHKTTVLRDVDYTEFWERFQIQPEVLNHNHVLYCPERDSIVYQTFNFHGGHVGTMERWHKWNPPKPGERKSKYYKEGDHPKMHVPLFPNGGNYSDLLCIVEDAVSAMKCQHYVTTLALIGTNLSQDVVGEILKAQFTRLLVMLDPGAEQEALKIIKDYDPFFRSITLKFLPKDPKDLSYEELEEIIHNVQAKQAR